MNQARGWPEKQIPEMYSRWFKLRALQEYKARAREERILTIEFSCFFSVHAAASYWKRDFTIKTVPQNEQENFK